MTILGLAHWARKSDVFVTLIPVVRDGANAGLAVMVATMGEIHHRSAKN